MNLLNRILQPWKGRSITVKFSVGVSLLLILMVVVAATGYVSLQHVRAADNSIRSSTEVERLILEMDRGMEKARRLHGGFFIYYPKIGLKKAHEEYAQPLVRQTARVVSISKSLKDIIDQPEVSDALSKSNVNVNLYLSSAKRFADTSIESFELATQLATPENGLEARLDANLAVLKAELTGKQDLTGLFHEMEHFVQRHRIARERFLMQSAFNPAFRMRQKIEAMPSFNSTHKQRIYTLLDQCEDLSEKILQVDVAINAKFKDFILQEEAATSVSASLVKLAKMEVKNSQEEITRTHKLAQIILFAVSFAGLIAALIIARVLNISITRRIIHLTSSAGEMRKGNLDVVAEEGAPDELGQLGSTFNFMAVRIKELVDNLEKKSCTAHGRAFSE